MQGNLENQLKENPERLPQIPPLLVPLVDLGRKLDEVGLECVEDLRCGLDVLIIEEEVLEIVDEPRGQLRSLATNSERVVSE